MSGGFSGPPPRRIALVRLSSIGDVVHAMPVATSLRRAWPAAEIHWAIQPGPLALVAPHPAVDRFLPFHRERGWRAIPQFRRLVAGLHYDLVMALHVNLKAGLATRLLKAPVRVGYDRARARELNWLFTTHRIPARPPAHVQDEFFEFLEWLGVPVVPRWQFAFSAEERAAQRSFFERIDRPVLAVVLRTTRPEKDWILERYARVLEVAEFELGLRAVIVGGTTPDENAAAETVRDQTRARVLDARAHDLRRLAWLLDGSAVLLSPDTGPLHLAVAVDTPTIGLYGYTDPKRVGPYRRFGELLVDRYSRPSDTVASRETRPGNMESITVRDVVAKLELAVARYVRSTPPRTGARTARRDEG